MAALTEPESSELQLQRSVSCSITSHAEQLARLGDAWRRLSARASRHPRQRDHVQPAELRPAPPILLADRVVVLLRVQSTVLADRVLPQLGEDRIRVVA